VVTKHQDAPFWSSLILPQINN